VEIGKEIEIGIRDMDYGTRDYVVWIGN